MRPTHINTCARRIGSGQPRGFGRLLGDEGEGRQAQPFRLAHGLTDGPAQPVRASVFRLAHPQQCDAFDSPRTLGVKHQHFVFLAAEIAARHGSRNEPAKLAVESGERALVRCAFHQRYG